MRNDQDRTHQEVHAGDRAASVVGRQAGGRGHEILHAGLLVSK